MQSFKNYGQQLLKKSGLYNRLKGSVIYDFYWSVADATLIAKRSAEVAFYQKLLGRSIRRKTIFDIGANHGQKVDVFLRLGAKVVAAEPDKANQRILAEKFLKWRMKPKPVTVVGKAVGEKCEVATMWVDAPGSAKNTLSQKWVETLRQDESRFGKALEFEGRTDVEVVTMEELIRVHGEPFFIKIDVEGFELSVIRGMRKPVPFLSFELNLPEFLAEGIECVELLAALAKEGQFNYSVDCYGDLALEKWRSKEDFLEILKARTEESIEVFWKTVPAGS